MPKGLKARRTKAKPKPKKKTGQKTSSTGYGHLIREARKEAGLSQAALAKATGLNQVYISQIENNKREITQAQAEKLAQVLGLDTNEMGIGNEQ